MDVYGVAGVPDVFMVHMLLVCGKILVGDAFFFLISNKFYWYQKRDTLVHRECTNQQIKNKNYKNDWFRKVANQSKKVLKKNNLRSNMDFSLSSKHLLFLSLQRHHIKQWGTINHI